jgi:hypothetical protein
MANYCATCRTNYFRVRDVFAFGEWADQYSVTVADLVVDSAENPVTKYALLGEDPDGGGWPSWNPETDEEINFVEELSKHLADGEVAVLIEVGAEKQRYVIGYAVAVDNSGRTVVLSLDEIYGKAKEAFNVKEITRAEY